MLSEITVYHWIRNSIVKEMDSIEKEQDASFQDINSKEEYALQSGTRMNNYL